MALHHWLIIPHIIFIFSISLSGTCEAKSLPDFAILSQIKGKIKVGSVKKMVEGTDGMLLSQRHLVKLKKMERQQYLLKTVLK